MPDIILLVDDDTLLSSILIATLTRKGYIVHYASTLDEARQLLDVHAANLTLAAFDVRLPDGEGWDVVGEMRASADPVRVKLPVIMISSYPMDRARTQLLSVTAYLQKPFSVPIFIKTVEEIAEAATS